MEALISGQAGLVVLTDGARTTVLCRESSHEGCGTSAKTVPLLLQGATDVEHVPSISRKDALSRLRVAAERDLALHLALIMIDGEEEPGTRQMAAEDIEGMLADEGVYSFVADRLCSAPLPGPADLSHLRTIKTVGEHVGALTLEVESLQPVIHSYSVAWQGLPSSLFTEHSKRQFETELRRIGAMRRLARAGNDAGQFGLARFECQQALEHLFPSSRQVLGAWLSPFAPERSAALTGRAAGAVGVSEAGETAEGPGAEHGRRQMSDHEIFENVTRQKEAIVAHLRKGDLSNVRRFVRDLVHFQLGHGGPEYAAKSLCDLANEAKEIRAFSLQLELATKASEIAPADAWTYGQVADAYCCLQQFDEASAWFQSAADRGDTLFALTGSARILREQGRLDKALAQYEQIRESHPDELPAWLGTAEVQRDLLLLEDALHTYTDAAKRFPDETVPLCGRAAVLEELGQLEDALSAYDQIIRAHPENIVANNGRAEVLRKLGRMDDALLAYEETRTRFPSDPVAYCGGAQVLKKMGKLDEALSAYEEAIELFGFQPIPWGGKAEVLRQMGKLDDALQAYDEAAERFPGDVWTLGARANVLKDRGDLQAALQAYDQIVAAFPHNVFAWCGRAHLLKELGHLEEALDAHEQVIRWKPHDQHSRFAKAAVLVVLGRYDEALRLLPADEPRTRDEWVAFHIRGMILLKVGDMGRATKLFEKGLATIPFADERKFFQNALAVCSARQKQLRRAAEYLGSDSSPTTDALRIHVYGALNKCDEARDAYERLASACPPNLIALRDELAARYSLRPAAPAFDWDWVFDQECRAILLQEAA